MTISRTGTPPGDIRVEVARATLAELPEAGDNERPYYWIGRLRAALRELVIAWPDGTPGGLDSERREVLAAALSDAIATARTQRALERWSSSSSSAA